MVMPFLIFLNIKSFPAVKVNVNCCEDFAEGKKVVPCRKNHVFWFVSCDSFPKYNRCSRLTELHNIPIDGPAPTLKPIWLTLASLWVKPRCKSSGPDSPTINLVLLILFSCAQRLKFKRNAISIIIEGFIMLIVCKFFSQNKITQRFSLVII